MGHHIRQPRAAAPFAALGFAVACLVAAPVGATEPEALVTEGAAEEAAEPPAGLPAAARLKPGVVRRDEAGRIVLDAPPPPGDPQGRASGNPDVQTALPGGPGLKPGEIKRNEDGQLVLEARAPKVLRLCPAGDPDPACRYRDLALALAGARPGDTLVLAPGIYRQSAVVTVPLLTIRGEPGAHLKGQAAEGKAALVIRANDVVVEGLECSEIAVRDRNGACIRIEGDNLTVRNVYFHDSENGILGGPGRGILLVEDSVFERNGAGGRAHGVYINPSVETFIFRRNRILSTKGQGHGLKSRARRTIVEDNVIATLDGLDSRAIDIPNGGDVIIRGNLLEKGPRSENRQMIGLALEGNLHPVNRTVIENNLVIFDFLRPKWQQVIGDALGFDAPKKGIVVLSKSPGEVLLRDNDIVGPYVLGSEVTARDNRAHRGRDAAGLPPYPELPSGAFRPAD